MGGASWRTISVVVAGLVTALLAACSGTPRLAVPASLASQAEVSPDFVNIRYWGDTPPKNFNQLVAEIVRQRRASGSSSYRPGRSPHVKALILSGGGDNGAYGAGLLNGWSDRGARPKFDIVTGVSTGALIGPFAFLGSEYDNELREVYTSYSSSDYFTPQPLRGLLGGDALADNHPLYRLIEKYATTALIEQVAREHRKGRRFFVQTTNLDAQRPVIWDMGAIANEHTPRARELFRRVLLASAAIPALFAPVMIKVRVDGRHYEEMHVDGGTVSQEAGLSAWLLNTKDVARRYHIRPRRTVYIVRNNRVGPEWQNVKRTVVAIASRAASTTLKYQGNADLYVDYIASMKRGEAFNVTAIGSDFRVKYVGPFNRQYMRELYKYGYSKARYGNPWYKSPTKLLQTSIDQH